MENELIEMLIGKNRRRKMEAGRGEKNRETVKKKHFYKVVLYTIFDIRIHDFTSSGFITIFDLRSLILSFELP